MAAKKTLGSYTKPENMSSRDRAIADGYTSGSYIDHALNKNKRGQRVSDETRKHEKHEHKAHQDDDDDSHVEKSDPKYYGR